MVALVGLGICGCLFVWVHRPLVTRATQPPPSPHFPGPQRGILSTIKNLTKAQSMLSRSPPKQPSGPRRARPQALLPVLGLGWWGLRSFAEPPLKPRPAHLVCACVCVGGLGLGGGGETMTCPTPRPITRQGCRTPQGSVRMQGGHPSGAHTPFHRPF